MTINRDVVAVQIQALGAEAFVPRFTAFMISAIMKRAEELYPLPDPKPFEQPLPDALIEGDVISAAQNPEYVKLVAQVMLLRNQHLQDAILASVEIDKTSRVEIIVAFAAVLQPMRAYADLPEDDFVAALRHCILKPAEYREIINAATKEQALSQEEVREGLRIFRSNIQRRAADGDHREESASDLPEVEQVQA